MTTNEKIQEARRNGHEIGYSFTKESGMAAAVKYLNQQCGTGERLSPEMFGHWDGFMNGMLAA